MLTICKFGDSRHLWKLTIPILALFAVGRVPSALLADDVRSDITIISKSAVLENKYCAGAEVTARMPFPPDEVYQAFIHPEHWTMYVAGVNESADHRSKTLDIIAAPGVMNLPNGSRRTLQIQYQFDPQTRTVSVRPLSAGPPWSLKYSLLTSGNGAETLVHYSSTECISKSPEYSPGSTQDLERESVAWLKDTLNRVEGEIYRERQHRTPESSPLR